MNLNPYPTMLESYKQYPPIAKIKITVSNKDALNDFLKKASKEALDCYATPDWKIQCDPILNTNEVIEKNELRCRILSAYDDSIM